MDTGPIFDKANKMLKGNLLWTGGGGITILFFRFLQWKFRQNSCNEGAELTTQLYAN